VEAYGSPQLRMDFGLGGLLFVGNGVRMHIRMNIRMLIRIPRRLVISAPAEAAWR